MIKKRDNVALDSKEKELLRSFEKGEWKTVAHLRKEKALAKRAARNFLRLAYSP